MKKVSATKDWTNVSEVTLVYKTKVKTGDRPKLSDSRQVYDFLMTQWNRETIEWVEEFKVVLLNQANLVLGIFQVSTGGRTGTVADPRLIFVAALKAAAVNIILTHAHPSGNLVPSRADEELTTKIRDAGKLLDIRVLDHLIVSKDGYYSFADQGML